MELKKEFLNNIKEYLGSEYDSFIKSFDLPNEKGFHVNQRTEDLCNVADYISCNLISNFQNCYSTDEARIGSHPLYHAGIIYSQDPSAMMPIMAIAPFISENMKILDLCGAPGGKSSQLASLLSNNQGVLVSNEINKSRNQILKSNIERMGYTNVLVTNKSADELATDYSGYFDIIVIDAPCSGEGMFRKYPESIDEWNSDSNIICSNRQQEIIDEAIKCLKPGGYIMYSTCTYSHLENEEIVRYMVDKYNFEILLPNKDILDNSVSIAEYDYYSKMQPINGINGCRRFYPHKYKGEGQFLCVLKSTLASTPETSHNVCHYSKEIKAINKATQAIINDTIGKSFDFAGLSFLSIGSQIIALDINNYPDIPRQKVTMAGAIVGEITKNRLVPHHQLFHMLGNRFKNKIDLTNDIENLMKYLHGEEIFISDAVSGFGVITYLGAPIGGFKAVNGRLKNYYPKGLRNNN